MNEAQRGAKAIDASDYPTAIRCYTQALAINPHATEYYVKRSTAYSRLKPADGGPKGDAALHDAEMAVALGVQRGRRELILAGQMRRGIVLFQLERFGDADHVFQILRNKLGPSGDDSGAKSQIGAVMSGKEDSSEKGKFQELKIWEMKAKARLAKLGPEDEKAKVTVKEVPDIKVGDAEELKKTFQAQLQDTSGPISTENTRPSTQPATSAAVNEKPSKPMTGATDSTVVKPPVEKTRHEWYQTSETVVVTLYAKGVPKDKAQIDIQDTSLSISFPLASGSEFQFSLDPLYGAIKPSSSKSSIMSTKIEVTLYKKQAGKWPALEGAATDSKSPSALDGISPNPSIKPEPSSESSVKAKAPVYPTSSKSGAKDWDKVASALTKKKKEKPTTKDKSKDGSEPNTAEDKEEDGYESDTSEYGTGDQVDSFFKKLYANSDPDTQRAMVKSFYESDGTSLSTNWNEVGKGKVTPKHD